MPKRPEPKTFKSLEELRERYFPESADHAEPEGLRFPYEREAPDGSEIARALLHDLERDLENPRAG